MHGITKNDRGIVGYCDVYGNPWHNRVEYKAINGPVSLADTITVIDYEVVKVPLAFHIPPELADCLPNHNGFVPQSTQDKDGLCGPLMFALVRADTGNQVYEQSVSQEYTIYQNRTFLEKVQEAILKDNPQIVIESAGTLFGGRICFVNLILNQFRITKDPSDQIVRIMFYNAFGGRSITACMHIIRVVCNNTVMLAEAQGALNETLRKFRHTTGAPERVAKHVFDLAKLNQIAEDRKEILNHLSDVSMTAKDMENFLANLIPIEEDAGKGTKTGRQNRRDAIETLFNDTPDLQGQIGRTRYAAFQAVLAYSQHHTIPEGSTEVDSAFAWFDVSTGGVRNDMNQKAFAILILPEIPEPKTKKVVEAP
jgi:phage/plasmid-like protein (TIGR03299 family)